MGERAEMAPGTGAELGMGEARSPIPEGNPMAGCSWSIAEQFLQLCTITYSSPLETSFRLVQAWLV